MSFNIIHGDCREVMASLDAESIDAIVCDPPYGLSFMGKGWDSFKQGDIAMRRSPEMDSVNTGASKQGGRQRACADYQKRQAKDMLAFQEAMHAVFAEALRVAKPGAHLLAFGGTRTYHRLACAIEDAGWEIRDCVMWVYGSGFPKSHDVSKAIDKAAGAERERIRGVRSGVVGATFAQDSWSQQFKDSVLSSNPITDAARQWSGWGTALKPAWEPIIVARKPLVGTVAENVLRHGTGGINVDGCRVGTGGGGTHCTNRDESGKCRGHKNAGRSTSGETFHGPDSDSGRWPANLIHDGSDEVVGLFPANVKGGTWNRTAGARHFNNDGEPTGYETSGSDASTGSAARFFYCAKASKADRDEGCEGMKKAVSSVGNLDAAGRDAENPRNYKGGSRERVEAGLTPTLPRANHHPTVKPTALMRYLCRLVTPPGGTVLDPFCGSGSTGKGAVLEGFNFIGIEREAEYVEIARARVAAVVAPDEPPLFRQKPR